MDWNEVLATEYQGHNYSPINLVQVSTKYNGMWICPVCGNKAYDNGSWCCASLQALAYMMDPRNSINESDVFQFKDIAGSDVSYNDIARVVSSYGSYINNSEAIQAIVDASNLYNINGYFLVSTIINEQGKNGTTITAGQGYNGSYVGVYNYFNIGASGNGTATIIKNALSKAQSSGWTSIRASILGGAQVVANSYINTYHQNTMYYQKFNVSSKSALASHQYQQNIMAAQTKGTALKSFYADLNSREYTFIIPIFENMPASKCGRPSTSVANTITYENGVIQNVSKTLTVRASAGGTAIASLNNGESVKILQRASNQVKGYYWDLIISNKNGTYGYVAREVGGDVVLASTGSSGNNSSSASASNNESVQTQTSSNIIRLTTTGIAVTSPDFTVEHLKSQYQNVSVTNSTGAVVSSGQIGTGYKATIEGTTYTISKRGDINGDGNITIIDAVQLLNAIKGDKILSKESQEAAKIKNNQDYNISDVVYLLNYIQGNSNINL